MTRLLSHHMEGLIDKILERVIPVLVLAPMGECWIWIGRFNRNDYGRFKIDGTELMAHRLTYQLLRGEIPENHLLDHVCRNRCCVNPYHLEPVTHQVNTLRGKALLFGRDIHPQHHQRN